MSRYTLFLLPFALALSGPVFSAEAGKNNQIDSLTSFQLGDYSLKVDGDNPRKTNDLYDLPGLQSFRKETFNPYLGLKFSSPLKENFLNPGPEIGIGATGGIENQ